MKKISSLLVLGMFLVVATGCSKKTCEVIADECDMTSNLEDTCVDDYKDEKDCKDSLKDLRDCVEDHGCAPENADCNSEFQDVYDDCDGIADWFDDNQPDYQ